ncbi:hypothetical protein NFI96_005599 [Prochilodus magdalenae]|nr:hypothetical protein NFI96_005599 [Prochilodus magdalenae]
MIVDFRRGRHAHLPLHVGGSAVEVVSSYRYLGVHLSNNLTWSNNTSSLVRKAHQRLYFLRRLRRAGLGSSVLISFYRCVVESVLCSSINVWHGSCSAADRKALQRVVKAAQRSVGVSLPTTTTDIYTTRCRKRATCIMRDPTHPAHSLFVPLPSGRRLRSVKCRTNRLRNSFIPEAPDKQVFSGEEVTLGCVIQGGGVSNWQYSWSKGGSSTPVSNAQQYSISSVTQSHSGTYTCRGTVRGTSRSSHTSDAVTLSVSDPPTPTLTVESRWSPLFTGESVTLKCEIQSYSNWRYQWYKGSRRTAVSQSQTNTFTIRSAADQGQYWCRGERDYRPRSSQNSSTVTLTVKDLPRATLTVEPESPLFTGESVTLKCEIQSYSDWRYQLYKRSSGTAVSQSQTHTFTIRSAADQGQYWCRGERDNRPTSSQNSRTVTLTVKERPTPVVSIQPDNQVFRGETVTLSCVIQGGGVSNWRYSWFKGGSYTPVSNVQQYSISSVTQSHSGTYTCRGTVRGTSRSSHTSDNVTLTVSDLSNVRFTKEFMSVPRIDLPTATLTVEPESRVFTGESVTLKCVINPHDERRYWRYQWYKQNKQRGWTTFYQSNTDTITIRGDYVINGDQYFCRGETHYRPISSQDSNTVTLTVEALPTATLTVEPESRVFTGESVTLKCVINTHGGWTYQWYKRSKQGGWTAVSQSEYDTVNGDTLTIREDAVISGDQFCCRGKIPNRPAPSQYSKAVTLTVEAEVPKPELTSSHKGAALIGNPVVLYCKLDQSAGWKFYWSKHTQNPENETETKTPSYTISSVSVSDGGQYRCRAGRGDPVYYSHYSDALWINTTGLMQFTIPDDIRTIEHLQSAPVTREELLRRFSDVFNSPVESVPGDVHFELDPSVTPVQCAPHNVPIAMKADVKAQLDEYQADGHIADVTEPTDWISNMARIFTLVDARHAFLQCRLDDESSLMTTFWTPWGRKRWLKLPFGVSVVPEVYQRKQHELLAGLKGVEPIADDILVVGCGDTDNDAVSDHDTKLLALMERCRKVVYKPGPEMFISDTLSRTTAKCRGKEPVYQRHAICSMQRVQEDAEHINQADYLNQKESMLSHEVPNRPWQILSMDLFSHRQKDYLLVVDHYSDFWEIDLLPDLSAETVIKRCKAQFARHGQPDKVITDNGLQFTAQFKRFACDWEFEHVTSSPRYPKANGKAESAVKIAKNILRKAMHDADDPWKAILHWRNTPTENMNSSPAAPHVSEVEVVHSCDKQATGAMRCDRSD